MSSVSQHAAPVHDLARSYEDVAELYDWSRPSYPVDMFSRLPEPLPLRDRVVVDVGAGTGKASEVLRRAGANVTAVEPLPSMREVLSRRLPDVKCVDGTAESLPHASETVDVVTAFEAFHWFEPEAAWSEVDRVLRPGGSLVVGWLHRQSGTDWQRDVYEVLAPFQDGVPASLEVGDDWKAGWTDVFSPLRETRITYELKYSVFQVRAMFETFSYVAVLPDELRNGVLGEIAKIAASAATDDSLTMQLELEMWACNKS